MPKPDFIHEPESLSEAHFLYRAQPTRSGTTRIQDVFVPHTSKAFLYQVDPRRCRTMRTQHVFVPCRSKEFVFPAPWSKLQDPGSRNGRRDHEGLQLCMFMMRFVRFCDLSYGRKSVCNANGQFAIHLQKQPLIMHVHDALCAF